MQNICNTLGGMWTLGSLFLLCDYRTFSNRLHLVLQSKHTDREKLCSPVSPRLTPALPHVVTLIIVFFHMFHTCESKIHLSSIQPGNLEHKSL